MPTITLTNITKRWKNYFGVDNLSLEIPDNSFITLLGPSGCGKTTILRMIAGLETPTEGRITIGDNVVFDSEKGINVPANKRRVGFLFQNYALWPNMTVYQNIMFGLKNIKEELPVIDVEAKRHTDIIRALQNGKRIKAEVLDCCDKNGKLDNNRAYVKLIDAFELSIFSAKTVFELKIHESDNPEEAANKFKAEYEQKLSAILDAHKAKGEEINKDFEVVKSGNVVREVRKLTDEEMDSRLRQVARIVKIGMFMDRYPAELSGGQQQRVAIARTLAPRPQVLFMDEPLSNLDAKLRLEMRYELQRLHVETGSTFVYVTHDQMEAMTLATQICLVENGVLQQYAPPLEVYRRPENLFVADFVGNPSINFVEARGNQQEDGSISLDILGGVKVKLVTNENVKLSEWFEKRDSDAAKKQELRKELMKGKHYVEKANKDEVFKYHIAKVMEEDSSIQSEPVVSNEDFVLAIRPEAIGITSGEGLHTTIYGAMPTGMESTLKLRFGDYLLTGVIFGNTAYKIGENVSININGDDILLFDRKSGMRVATGHLVLENA
ncbi:ABC transporter ATP-binding protein [Lachnoanaerobaculum gingivalis]|jgi:ABC transporter, ATP-binding protein|uniref:ABC transporter ATP-binding protein n=1 Tax=Lachnoanaerobaculum gingivalis TaxID=2490855 RepID=UPI000F1C7B18|nr:ATP-binding cassette domain-containing protein [Lachnoanaerobaculum gingivalis]RKW46489.1 MAG: ATP-binding cassette domain-containing protein [Lachnospiraceae bacterium]WHE87144.1 ATP-binding cassette domain-containing protein [Lachnoanaerobaculum gingivalis]